MKSGVSCCSSLMVCLTRWDGALSCWKTSVYRLQHAWSLAASDERVKHRGNTGRWLSFQGRSTKIKSVIPIFESAMETITDICNLMLNSWLLGPWVSQGKVRTLNRWGGTLNHFSMACLPSNRPTRTKSYWSRTNIVEIIVDGWVVSFFETHCIWRLANHGAL